MTSTHEFHYMCGVPITFKGNINLIFIYNLVAKLPIYQMFFKYIFNRNVNPLR